MLYQLQTLKSESPSGQVATLNHLAVQNLGMATELVTLCHRRFDGHVFQMHDQDPRAMLLLALAALAYTELGTVLDYDQRRIFISDLQRVCEEIGLDWNDIMVMDRVLISDLIELFDKQLV